MTFSDLGWWLLHLTGSDDMTGRWYGFWSGFGGDLALFGGLTTLAWGTWRKHNCHVGRCWRIGRHLVVGTGYVVCRRHHPHGAPSHEDVIRAHEEAQT